MRDAVGNNDDDDDDTQKFSRFHVEFKVRMDNQK